MTILRQWTFDECEDANGYMTIRIANGTPNGDTEAMPIATVYDLSAAALIAAAPDLHRTLSALMEFWNNGTPVHAGAEVVADARAALALV